MNCTTADSSGVPKGTVRMPNIAITGFGEWKLTAASRLSEVKRLSPSQMPPGSSGVIDA